VTLTDLDCTGGCKAELEQQMVDSKDVQQMLMTDNEALQQQIIKLKQDLVRSLTISLSFTESFVLIMNIIICPFAIA